MNIEDRLRQVESRIEIQELVARYCFTIDARDIDGIAECFTRDATFRSMDGAMSANGRRAVIDQFHERFAVLGPSNHYTHDHVIYFNNDDPSYATGLVNAHAEVVRNDAVMWAALRYHDKYSVEEGRWRFKDRSLAFFYYLQPAHYSAGMIGTLRNQAYAEPHAADFPENESTWQEYYATRPRAG